MKFIILLFFSSFLYAQDTNNSPDGSTQQNTPQENTVPQPQEEEQKKNPVEKPKSNSDQKKQKKAPSAENQQPDSSKQEKKKQPSAENQAPAPKKQDKNSTPDASKEDKSGVKKAVAVPQQPLPPVPPEEPIPYYNPLHPQSPSTYQEGDLPSESLSKTAAHKKRKHRLSINGKLLDFLAQGNLKKINSNISADYGYSRSYFEVGPYVSFGLNDFDLELRQLQNELTLSAGAFFEVNFMSRVSRAKNIPSIGLKAGYKRKENVNYIVGQLYVTMKFFLNPQTALFASLAPYYQYKLNGRKGEWGVEVPAGLRFYFH